MQTETKTKSNPLSVKNLAACAMLAALSVVLARLIIPMPNASTRFSIEAVPIFLAGMLFGPMAGGMVGFCADLVGCLFSGYGYNPLFCVPPILYGVFAGCFRGFLKGKPNFLRVLLAFLPPVVLGSIAWQSAALAFVYNSKGSFQASLIYFLTTRTIQFAVTMVLDAILVTFLARSAMASVAAVPPSDGETSERK